MDTLPPARTAAGFAGLLFAIALAGCSGDGGIPPADHEAALEKVRRQGMAIDELEKKLEAAKDIAEQDSPELKQTKKKVNQLEGDLEESEEALEVLEEEFEAYKEKYRVSIRGRDLEENVGQLLVDGRTYDEVIVTRADPLGVRIRYAGGTGKLQFTQLGDEMRERFGYHPGDAETFIAAADTRRAASAKAVKPPTRTKSPMTEAQRLAAIGPTKDEIRKANAEIQKLVRVMKDSRARAERLNAAADKADFSGRGGKGSNARRQEANRLRNLADKAEQRVFELHARIKGPQ